MTRLMITADWCQTCKAIKPIAEEEGYTIVEAEEFDDRYTEISVDVNPITTLPTFVAIDETGKVNAIHRGAMTVYDVRRFGT